jgi:shikimate 5-dehydrogenase
VGFDILGAGGAARAAACALRSMEIPFTVTSRTPERSALIADQFGGNALSWEQRHTNDATILINTTPLGMAGGISESPVPAFPWRSSHIAFETVYVPRETLFLADARRAGATVIPGVAMLLWQGVKQFELFTGVKAPVEVMADVVKVS